MSPELPMEAIDSVISTELPDLTTDPELFAIVQKFQIHPPTHLSVSYSRCNKQGSCTFGFPFQQQTTTTLNEFGRVQYRRRNPQDSWVVSYIPFLSRALQCHIHVDVCFTVNVFMYLYKYLFKGPDHTHFLITQHQQDNDEAETQLDEFKDYINGRYLSSSEAVWRIFNFHITQQTPTVKALRVHLPNQQLYQMYRANHMESGASQLLRYFSRPLDPLFDTLLYCDYFSQYILYPMSSTIQSQQHQQWTEDTTNPLIQHNNIPPMIVQRRIGKNIICRLRTVPPKVGELFYLRVLLLHKDARAFQDLRTIRGVEYTTFQQAAKALGLFDNQNEAIYVLEEGLHLFYRPSQLRFLFANLLFDIPFPAIDLWNRFRDALCADCQQSPTVPLNYDHGLQFIEHILFARGAHLQSFGLPIPHDRPPSELEHEGHLLALQASYTLQQAQQKQKTLPPDQKCIFDTILHSTGNSDPTFPKVFFIDGPAGRGKTFLVNAVIQQLRGEEDIVVVVGTTALSVTLYDRGRTAHSMFGIPITEVSIYHYYKIFIY